MALFTRTCNFNGRGFAIFTYDDVAMKLVRIETKGNVKVEMISPYAMTKEVKDKVDSRTDIIAKDCPAYTMVPTQKDEKQMMMVGINWRAHGV